MTAASSSPSRSRVLPPTEGHVAPSRGPGSSRGRTRGPGACVCVMFVFRSLGRRCLSVSRVARSRSAKGQQGRWIDPGAHRRSRAGRWIDRGSGGVVGVLRAWEREGWIPSRWRSETIARLTLADFYCFFRRGGECTPTAKNGGTALFPFPVKSSRQIRAATHLSMPALLQPYSDRYARPWPVALLFFLFKEIYSCPVYHIRIR